MAETDHPELIDGVAPYYHDAEAGIAIYHADCRELLPRIPEGSVDLVLTDPPYGINHPTDFASRRRGVCVVDYPPVVGDDKPFEPVHLLGFRKVILWGANYYCSYLPGSSGWLTWDKRDGMKSNDQADCELAWSNCVKGARLFRHAWNGYFRASERREGYHPTQKPVALMLWCLRWAKVEAGQLVLDPYMGSGPIPVACKRENVRCIGIEIEERYCEIAANRLRQGVFDFGKASVP